MHTNLKLLLFILINTWCRYVAEKTAKGDWTRDLQQREHRIESLKFNERICYISVVLIHMMALTSNAGKK